jgi:ubiquinone/menaquinone biosynthesis C-methylase UbiE
LDWALGLQKEMIPPRRVRAFIGSGDYRAIGDEFLVYFRQLCGLQPGHHILDLGCGAGRMAVPLAEYLSPQGSYEGMDIIRESIDWCLEHISRKFPNFRFQLADVYNKCYNPKGRYQASEYKFPFADNSFDFAFLTSVFTHMLPQEVTNYMRELKRVLKPRGKCLITWLMLNPDSEALVNEGKSFLNVVHPLGDCRIMNPEVPEDAVAYPEDKILQLYDSVGLLVEVPLRYGSWCGRAKFLSYQDICIARKPDKK